MTYPRSPREGAASVTVPLDDLALSERESVFHAPRAGDVALLGVLVAVLLGNGAWIWRSLGVSSHAGRAIFFGLLLLCAYWCASVYIFKLSLSARISPRSLSVVRGPWRVEIRWSELARLMERVQPLDGRRYRWVIALAHDGRRISVREDAIGDYARFRSEAYARYRVWRDHGGTWGAIGGGPFIARETVRDEAQWWAIAAVMIALPGAYFALLLPETNPLGYALLAVALGCLALVARVFLQRQTYTIERQFVETRSALKRVRLTWSEITRVERTRAAVSNVILAVVSLGRLALRLAARGDTGIRSFAWAPRVPEYLALRGGGRQARVRLHRLMQPDELLAWIEFYDQASRWSSTAHSASRPSAAPAGGVAETAKRAATGAPGAPGQSTDRATGRPVSRPSGPLNAPGAGANSRPLVRPTAGPASGPVSGPISARAGMPNPHEPPDLAGPSGPLDPWGGGRAGEVILPQPSTPSRPFTGARTTARMLPDLPDEPPAASQRGAQSHESQDDAWLRETSAHFSMGNGGNGGSGAVESLGVIDADPAPGASPEPEPWRKRAPQWEAGDQREQWEQRMPAVRPTAPQSASQPASQPARPAADGGWAAAWGEQADDARAASQASDNDGERAAERDEAAEAAPQTPWRDADWQPPILPRFGPPGAGQPPRPDEPFDQHDPHGERH